MNSLLCSELNQASERAFRRTSPRWQFISTSVLLIAMVCSAALETLAAAPELLCPSFIRVPCETASGARVSFTVTATGDGEVRTECVPPSGSVFPVGTNDVRCTATDTFGESSICSFPVVVDGGCVDDPCVAIQCPSDIRTPCAGSMGTVVTFTVSTTNRCGAEPVTLTCDPPSGTAFPPGLTTVLCRGQVGRVNSARCMFTVEVEDETPPSLDCPDNLVVEAQGVDGAFANWRATASDDCDTNVTVRCEPPSDSFFPLGVSAVRCFATDSSGNLGRCGFTVTVREGRPLRISQQSPTSVTLRWYVPGVPEVAFSLTPPVDWQTVAMPIEQNGDERTLVYPLHERPHFFRLAAEPLAPPPDEDEDGVPDRLDKCPGTPLGDSVNAGGCSLIELVAQPERATADAMAHLNRVLEQMRSFETIVVPTRTLEASLAGMEAALGLIRAGEILSEDTPGGVDQFSTAVAELRQAHSGLMNDIAAMQRELLANPPDTGGYGDSTPEDTLIIALRVRANLLADGLDLAEAALESFETLAESISGRDEIRGTVMAINDAGRFIVLDDGRKIGLGQRHYTATITEGALVAIAALAFNDGSALAEDVTVLDAGGQIPADILAMRCLRLRIAPNQRFKPFGSMPYELHYPEAYEHQGTHWLEHGMRLAVVGTGCPTVVPDNSLVYRMALELYYKKTKGAYTTVTLASSLGPFDEPVALPSNIDVGAPALLTARVLRRVCPFGTYPDGCSAPQEMSVDTYSIRVSSRYFYGTALYSDTVFDIEDQLDEPGHRSAQVTVAFMSGLAAVSPVTFQAEGYLATASSTSWPSLETVGIGDSFAVFATDLYEDDPSRESILGVASRSALYWPRVSGTRNGRKFAYAAELPKLVRDAVSICQTLPHAFYRLPFKGGWPTWEISQGNFGAFTHKDWQSFAYDFPASQGTTILAARGGTVIDLQESFSVSNWDGDKCVAFNANYLVIQHQDGSTGNYLHMPINGVKVAKGQKVSRGDPIASVGNTGCSTGPHLHFDVRNASGTTTIPSRFEAWSVCEALIPFACPPIRECYVPAPGELFDAVFSTNKPWWQ